MTDLFEAALGYAARGWLVHPLKPRSKEPATAHGFKDATVDPVQIATWWFENPAYNIGIATEPSGLLVVDIDPRNYGPGSFLTVENIKCSADTYEVLTGGGGRHIYFQLPEEPHAKAIGMGIDLKGRGGYVVAPPSVTAGPYRVEFDGPVSSMPEHILAMVRKPAREPSAPAEYDPNDNRPGNVYIRNTNWPDLMEGWGYRRAGVGVDGQLYWTRPGKDSGISAVTGGDTDTLWVFSSSTPFETDRTYNRFGAYAVMHHEGDLSAAARALSDRPSGGGGFAITSLSSVGQLGSHEVVAFETEVTPETEYAFRGSLPRIALD